MRHADTTELDAARRARGLDGLPLAEMAVTDGAPAPRPKATAAMRGGRETARARLTPATLTGLRAKVYAGIHAHGPITRDRLADTLAMRENTINARCSELLKAGLIRVHSYDPASGRARLELMPTPTEAPDAR